MVEFDGTVEVVGPDGPVPFLDLFQGRDELVVYKHMWYDGAPHQGQCEGCTTTAWHLKDAVYLNARGVSFAVLTTGRWDEVASYVEFMGYTQPWYSVRGVEAPVGDSMGSITCFLRDGDRVFLTYSTTGRGNEPVNGSLGLLDMTPYGRREAWEDNPEGWPEAPAGRRAGRWAWRADLLVLALGRGRRRHLGPDQPPRAAVDPPRRDPRGDPRPARPPPLTRRRRRRWCLSARVLGHETRRPVRSTFEPPGWPNTRSNRWPTQSSTISPLVPRRSTKRRWPQCTRTAACRPGRSTTRRAPRTTGGPSSPCTTRRASWERFRDDTLLPALGAGIEGGFTTPPQETSFEVVNETTASPS